MNTIVKYSFEGKAKDLKLSHIPTNGGVILVKVDGYEFEVRMLNGKDARQRTYMARKAPAFSFVVWDWHVGYMVSLRNQLSYSARLQKEYADRRNAMLKAQGIELK